MKAYLIDATTRSITPVTLANGLDDIGSLIGYDTIESDAIDASGDRLFFDQRCFLREQTCNARFQIDNLAPVANKALVVGTTDDGTLLKEVMVDQTTLERRITWL